MALKTYLISLLTSLTIYGCTAPKEYKDPKIIEYQEQETDKGIECVLESAVGDFNGDGLYDICFKDVPPGGLTCAIDYDRDCMQDLVVWTSTLTKPKIYRGTRRLDHCQPNISLPRGPNYYIIKIKNEL